MRRAKAFADAAPESSPLAGEEGTHRVSDRKVRGLVRRCTLPCASPLTLPLRGSLPLPQGERGCQRFVQIRRAPRTVDPLRLVCALEIAQHDVAALHGV